ncbi:MAG: PQQ-binding-like beta-propeller repeat protein [Chloroflexi bacterium]|nr:PQQ-binding-like beta-propeller repeat protein [Chloroflexota bacterium]
MQFNRRPWRGKLMLSLAILAGVTLLGCATGVQPRGWSGGTVRDGSLLLGSMEGKLVALDISQGAILWEVPFEAAATPGGGFGCARPSAPVAIYSTPAVAGDLVYVTTYSGKVYAINAETGALRWVYPREGALRPLVGALTASQDRVYFGTSGGEVYALNAATGDRVWVAPVEGRVWSTPAVYGDTLYVGSFDKKLYALSAADGKKKWEFDTDGAIASSPLVYGDTVYVGSFDRHLYAIDASGGGLKWKFPAGNWFWATPVAYGDAIYAGNLDNKVYILNARSGGKLAEPIDLGSPIASSPALIDGRVVFATEAGKIYALDTATNRVDELRDVKEKVHAPLAGGQGVAYVHTMKDTVYAVNADTGAVREFRIKSR